MDRSYQRMYQAALAHYVRGETMAAIARHLKVSRSTVSRLLRDAREQGLVHISVAMPTAPSASGERLAEAFGIRVHVVDATASESERFSEVCQTAGRLLGHELAQRSGQLVGLAWGSTTIELVHRLTPLPRAGATLVQLGGAMPRTEPNAPTASQLVAKAARKLGGTVVEFPVPALFDSAEARAAVWRERSVREVRSLHSKLDVAVFGVGSLGAYGARLAPQWREAGIVADVCTTMLRADGTWQDLDINRYLAGADPATLASVATRICVVGNARKAVGLLAALRAGVITDLVVDEGTATTAVHAMDG